jgi:hypothetical protein
MKHIWVSFVKVEAGARRASVRNLTRRCHPNGLNLRQVLVAR